MLSFALLVALLSLSSSATLQYYAFLDRCQGASHCAENFTQNNYFIDNLLLIYISILYSGHVLFSLACPYYSNHPDHSYVSACRNSKRDDHWQVQMAYHDQCRHWCWCDHCCRHWLVEFRMRTNFYLAVNHCHLMLGDGQDLSAMVQFFRTHRENILCEGFRLQIWIRSSFELTRFRISSKCPPSKNAKPWPGYGLYV